MEQVIGVDRSPDALGLDKRMQGGGGAGDEPEPEPEPEELTGVLPPPRPAPPPGAPSRPKNNSPGDGPPVPRPPERPFTKTGRGEEGSARLKAAIHQMLGESPAAEQLAELAPALGDAIDLAAVLA